MEGETKIMEINKTEIINYIKQDIHLNPELKPMVYRILFLSTEAKDKSCYAHNAYFAKEFGKSERTIRRWLKILKDLGYITVKIIRQGKYIIDRTIQVSQSFFTKIANSLKNKAKNTNVEKPHNKAYDHQCDHQYGLSSRESEYNKNIKEKKDLLYKYNKSKKEKVFNNKRPQSYNEVFQFWLNKNFKGNGRDFWEYNTKRAWVDIRNWKRAAIGWAKKAKDDLTAFKANKTKHIEPYPTYYESVLPDLQYNNWDIL